MQINKKCAAWIASSVTVVAGAALLFAAAPAARADDVGSNTYAAIRAGVYYNVANSTQSLFDKYLPCAGIDYAFQQTGVSTRDIFSVDYIQTSHDGNTLLSIPVTIGAEFIGSPHAQGVRPFVGFGAGVYFDRVGINGSTTSTPEFGGYGEAGLDLTQNLFVEARYHIVSPIHGVNTDALEAQVGVRF